MNLKEHALQQFELLGWTKDGKFKDDMQEDICNGTLKLIEIFSEQGHSGMTAPYAISLFEKLASWKSIADITANREWWNGDIGSGNMVQSRIQCDVFSTEEDLKKNRAYFLDGIIFKDRDGCCYTNSKSRVWFDLPGLPPKSIYKKDYIPALEWVIKPFRKMFEKKPVPVPVPTIEESL